MSTMRNHRVYVVKYTTDNPYNRTKPHFNVDTIVAPNEEIAKAWVTSKINFVELISCTSTKLAAFIQEHVW